jgi:hypothetical protein
MYMYIYVHVRGTVDYAIESTLMLLEQGYSLLCIRHG